LNGFFLRTFFEKGKKVGFSFSTVDLSPDKRKTKLNGKKIKTDPYPTAASP